jgi:dolichol-phosphate mannosyltransferase
MAIHGLAAGNLLGTIKRFIRFGLVGASGVGVDMAVLFLLTDPRLLGWGLSLSKAIAAEVAIFNNFLWNEIWTFRDLAGASAGGMARARRLAKFNIICVAGIVFSIVLLNVQVRFLHFNVYMANFIAIFLVSIWNFAMNLKFGWREHGEG